MRVRSRVRVLAKVPPPAPLRVGKEFQCFFSAEGECDKDGVLTVTVRKDEKAATVDIAAQLRERFDELVGKVGYPAGMTGMGA